MAKLVITLIWGLVGGAFSGMFGLGGGIIFIPILTTLLGFDMQRAVGISLAVIVPTALMGSFRHWTLGNVDLRAVLLLAAGSLVGVNLGAWLADVTPASVLRRVFGLILLFVAGRMILSK
ncbi:MAG: sulfite exporter TauE/SafE family protein [Firmicutes bacterium]|nr:sulfite exporter TauE/SafE family protein [Bacillota bacterium]